MAVPSYALCVLAGMLLAGPIRRKEQARIGLQRLPGSQWVTVGALFGAIVGSKLGMVMFEPASALWDHLVRGLAFDFTGRTVVGGLIGGHIGVEVAKKLVGITRSTGDAWAVALPLAQGIGRVGCLLHGCCYGTPWHGPLSVNLGGVERVPVQLVEAVLVLGLAAVLWLRRRSTQPSGQLYRHYVVGYATIRFFVEFFRGDPGRTVGPLSWVQLVCGVVAVGFAVAAWGAGRSHRAGGVSAPG